MSRSSSLAACLFLLSTVALAEEGETTTAKTEDRKGASFNEIEHGFFVGVNTGFWATINPPGTGSKFSPGQSLQVEMGFDIGDRFSPALFFLASGNRMGSDYFAFNNEKTASGDYSMISPGATLKVRIVGFADAQEVDRTWIYARVCAGVGFYSPPGLKLPLDVFLSGGLGVEYFTRLRHFSIGFEANFNFMALTSSFGFSVLPSVRYAF